MTKTGDKAFCQACGRLTRRPKFCSDACRQTGVRVCHCGNPLLRRPQEPTTNFRARKTCSEPCRHQAVADQWTDPTIRTRMRRGLRLSQNTDEFVQRVRKHMQALHQDAEFIATHRARRLFTPEQVIAIRNDERSARLIAKAYGVHHRMILGIKSGRYYADVVTGDTSRDRD